MNLPIKYTCLAFSLYASMLCASDSSLLGAWNSALKNLFSRHYQTTLEHAVPTQTIASQTSDHSTNYALWTAALATMGAGALVYKYIKQKTRVQVHEKYNPELTSQLNIMFNATITKDDYQRNRDQMIGLVKNGARPDIQNSLNKYSLLERLVILDDFEFTQLCLQKGANPNISPFLLQTPLMWVKSKKIARCLLENKADPYRQDSEGETLLHHIVRRAAIDDFESTDAVLTFVCNLGLDPNQPNRYGAVPLHQLCLLSHLQKASLRTMAPLLWIGANLDQTNYENRQTPRQVLHEKSPELSVKAQALSDSILQFKEKLYSDIDAQQKNLLQTHMNPDSAGLVIEYVGRDKLPWKKAYWSELKKSSTKNKTPLEAFQSTNNPHNPLVAALLNTHNVGTGGAMRIEGNSGGVAVIENGRTLVFENARFWKLGGGLDFS